MLPPRLALAVWLPFEVILKNIPQGAAFLFTDCFTALASGKDSPGVLPDSGWQWIVSHTQMCP